ncbi:hypothetical protein GQ457_13G002520 [Hibiscus cannabinus]
MAESEHSSSENASMVSIEEHSKQDSELEFSDDEETLIIRMFNLVGERWSLIAGRIPGRTAEEIENFNLFLFNLYVVGLLVVLVGCGGDRLPEELARRRLQLLKAEEAARGSRQTKQDRCAEMRRKKDKEREAEERRLEEEANARKAKEEKDAPLEYIKSPKSPVLVFFSLTKSQMYSFGRSCCRIQIENLGRLSGVMDDRGKYIYIAMDETNAVADYIKREGRDKFTEEKCSSCFKKGKKIPKILGSGPSLWLLGPFDQLSFMSDLDVQIPSAFDPFADANAEDSGAVTKDYVHIRIQQRNGRKSLTTVQGLKKEFSYNKILKDLKKEFCCNGTVVQDPELGQVIQLQGDQRKNVSTFLVQAGIVKKDNIKIHGF